MLVYGVGRLLAGHRFFSQESEHRSIIDTRLILWPRFAACVGEQSHTQNCGFHVRCWHHRQRLYCSGLGVGG
jgi:hypothetical protein